MPASAKTALRVTDENSAVAALIARHRAGDPAALNTLMVELYPSIHRMVARLASGRARDVRDDLVQSALEQVCRSIHAFEGRSRLSTFVFGICHRVVARAHRYQRIRSWFQREAEEICLPSGSTAPDELIDRARSVAEAQAVLAQLAVEERAAFVLFEVEELPLDEVALALGRSTRTVKRKLRTAREKILHAPAAR